MSLIPSNFCAIQNPMYSFFNNQCLLPVSEDVFLPSYLANYLKNGHVYTLDGNYLCKYCDDVAPSQSFCEKVVQNVRNFLTKKGYIKSVDEVPLSKIHENGNPILRDVLTQVGYKHESECMIVRVRVNPDEKRNLKEAVAFANREMQQALSNEASLELFLIELNRCLTKGLDLPLTNKEGYRSQQIYMIREISDQSPLNSIDSNKQDILMRIRKILSPSDYAKFTREEKFTAAEIKRINKKLQGIIFLATSYQNVPNAMNAFIKKLMIQLKQPTKSPNEIAAWAHVCYTEIHPHYDSNGKTARILFNMILAHFNQQALVFPSDEEYTIAVEQETSEPSSFLKYVQDKVIPWNENNRHHLS